MLQKGFVWLIRVVDINLWLRTLKTNIIGGRCFLPFWRRCGGVRLVFNKRSAKRREKSHGNCVCLRYRSYFRHRTLKKYFNFYNTWRTRMAVSLLLWCFVLFKKSSWLFGFHCNRFLCCSSITLDRIGGSGLSSFGNVTVLYINRSLFMHPSVHPSTHLFIFLITLCICTFT